jgi:hypothetical protein
MIQEKPCVQVTSLVAECPCLFDVLVSAQEHSLLFCLCDSCSVKKIRENGFSSTNLAGIISSTFLELFFNQADKMGSLLEEYIDRPSPLS